MFLVCLRASVWGGWNISGTFLLSIPFIESTVLARCGYDKVFVWVVSLHLISTDECLVTVVQADSETSDDLSSLNWLICTVRVPRHSSHVFTLSKKIKNTSINALKLHRATFKARLHKCSSTIAGFGSSLIMHFSSLFKRIVIFLKGSPNFKGHSMGVFLLE